MDNDEYQRIVEYENEIYDLNHERDQDSDGNNSAVVPTEHTDQDDDQISALSNPKCATSKANSMGSNDTTNEREGDFSDSAGLSEDERDMIYSRLYHSTSTLPTKNNITAEENMPPTKSTIHSDNINTEYTVPSTDFTFELDPGTLQPLLEPVNPVVETISLDEDDDFAFASRGRYFGPPQPDRPSPPLIICFRCHQPGHMRHDCPHQICRHCNAIDSHQSHKCPSLRFCQNCAQTGHTSSTCPIRHNDDLSKPCSMCGESGHIAATCHQIWRYYRPVEPSQIQMVTTIERYCYNCSMAGHLGDDCTRPRPLYVRGGKIGYIVSAFGEGNVPGWVELSNPALPNQKLSRRAKRKAKQLEENNKNDDDDDDGWFGDRPPEVPKQARKIGGIKLNKPARRKANANANELRRTGAGNEFTPSEDPFPRNPSWNLESRIRSPSRQGSHKATPVDSYRPVDSYHPGDSYRPRYNSESRQRTNYSNTRDLEARIDHGSRGKRAEEYNHRIRFS